MHRTLAALVVSISIPQLASARPLDVRPTTQACLGDFATFLACPAGSQRSGTECRATDKDHWSGSKRQGPAIFLRDEDETDPSKIRVSFAANYKNHEKTGRVFRFDENGVLESWSDLANDDYHGLSVTCLPNGRVWYLAYFDHGKLTGISRSWKASDGTFSYAFAYAPDGTSRSLDPTPALAQRPDELCRPVVCDVNAKPDVWRTTSRVKP